MKKPSDFEVMHFIRLIYSIAPHIMETVFMKGGCYRFYLVLKDRFPTAKAYWHENAEPGAVHVIARINGRFYDIAGEIVEVEYIKESRPMTKGEHDNAKHFYFREASHIARMAREPLSEQYTRET